MPARVSHEVAGASGGLLEGRAGSGYYGPWGRGDAAVKIIASIETRVVEERARCLQRNGNPPGAHAGWRRQVGTQRELPMDGDVTFA